MEELSIEVSRLQARVTELEIILKGKPSEIKSPNILGTVIDLGLADSATKARDFLARSKIGSLKDLEDYADLEKKNKDNQSVVKGDKP